VEHCSAVNQVVRKQHGHFPTKTGAKSCAARRAQADLCLIETKIPKLNFQHLTLHFQLKK